MHRHDRLIFFAHPRSGSSSLLRILQLHPDLHVLEEPFNEGYTSWAPGNQDYLSRIHDTSSLDAVLAEIFEAYNGVKILNYQLADDLTAIDRYYLADRA